MRTKDGSRNIETNTARVRAPLEGLEQFFRVGDTRTGVAKAHHHQVAFEPGGDTHLPLGARFERPLAVAGQIDKDLQEAVMIGLDQRQPAAHLPDHRDPGFAQRRLDDDAGLIEDGAQVGHHGFPVGSHVQPRGSYFLQAANERAQHLVLAVFPQVRGGRDQGGMRRGRRRSQVADLV